MRGIYMFASLLVYLTNTELCITRLLYFNFYSLALCGLCFPGRCTALCLCLPERCTALSLWLTLGLFWGSGEENWPRSRKKQLAVALRGRWGQWGRPTRAPPRSAHCTRTTPSPPAIRTSTASVSQMVKCFVVVLYFTVLSLLVYIVYKEMMW